MVVRRKTLGEVNININISDKTKPKKKKRRKATKRKGTILAPNFGSVAPIFPAYSFGTAERSKQEEEQFKTKELLLLTQGELKETKQKLLEYKPVPSVGRSQAPKTILSGSTRDLSKDAIPDPPPPLTRQSSAEAIKLMRQESIDKARETMLEARSLEQRLSTMRASQSKLPTFDRTPTTNIPAQQTLKPPPLIKQRSDSASSDLTDDSMRPLPDQPPAQEDAIEALSLMKQALRPSIQEPARPKVELEPPKLLIPRPPLLSVEENPSRLIRGEEMKSFLPEPLGIIQEVDKPKRIIAPVNQVPEKIKREPPPQEDRRYRQILMKKLKNPSLFDVSQDPTERRPQAAEDEGFESAESSGEELDKPKTSEEKKQREKEFEELRKKDAIRKQKEIDDAKKELDRNNALVKDMGADKYVDMVSKSGIGKLRGIAKMYGIKGTQKYNSSNKKELEDILKAKLKK